VRVQVGHVAHEEPTVERYGASAQRRRATRDALADEVQRLLLGLGARDARAARRVEEPAPVVPPPTSEIDPRQHLVRMVDHQRRALAEDVEVLVGDERRDLEDDARAHAEARRLKVDPDQLVRISRRRSPRLRSRSAGRRPCVSLAEPSPRVGPGPLRTWSMREARGVNERRVAVAPAQRGDAHVGGPSRSGRRRPRMRSGNAVNAPP